MVKSLALPAAATFFSPSLLLVPLLPLSAFDFTVELHYVTRQQLFYGYPKVLVPVYALCPSLSVKFHGDFPYLLGIFSVNCVVLVVVAQV